MPLQLEGKQTKNATLPCLRILPALCKALDWELRFVWLKKYINYYPLEKASEITNNCICSLTWLFWFRSFLPRILASKLWHEFPAVFAMVTKQAGRLLEILFNCLVLHINQDTLTHLKCFNQQSQQLSYWSSTLKNYKPQKILLLFKWEGNKDTLLPKMCK